MFQLSETPHNDVLQIILVPELDKELHIITKKRLTLLLYINHLYKILSLYTLN